MQKIKLLLLSGGKIHDFKGRGQVIRKALEDVEGQDVDYIEDDLSIFKSAKLNSYNLIVFYYTLGNLSSTQKNGLLNFVAKGKGFVGIHSAADSFRDCPEYRAMIGGHFVTHPKLREYQVSVRDSQHPITKDLSEFTVTDEQYILDYDPRVHILCSALWEGRAVPVAWTKGWGKGRVFYLALGHNPAACQDKIFQLLLQRGIFWVAHSAKDDSLG